MGSIPIWSSGGGSLKGSFFNLGQGQSVDIHRAVLTFVSLLDERGGGGELAMTPDGAALDVSDLFLFPAKFGKKYATFESLPGETPSVEVTLTRRKDGAIDAKLWVEGLTASAPSLCAGDTPKTHLWTELTIDDGFAPPVSALSINAFECVEKPNGDRLLRSLPRDLAQDFLRGSSSKVKFRPRPPRGCDDRGMGRKRHTTGSAWRDDDSCRRGPGFGWQRLSPHR